jgi:hypothetical protein
MNYTWIMSGVAAVVLLAGSAFAGSACCASKKGEGKAAMSACAKATSGLELSAEQQAKIAEIETACQAAGSTEESCQKAKADIRALLTDDQKAKFDAAWDKMSEKKADGSCG